MARETEPPDDGDKTVPREAVDDVIQDNNDETDLLPVSVVIDMCNRAASNENRPKGWRYGQCWFNTLKELRPDLAEEIRGTKYDPYFDTYNVFMARLYLMREYGKEEAK